MQNSKGGTKANFSKMADFLGKNRGFSQNRKYQVVWHSLIGMDGKLNYHKSLCYAKNRMKKHLLDTSRMIA